MVTRREHIGRNAIFWADLGPPAGRRPVVIVSRDAATAVLNSVIAVPITRTIRGIRSEVPLGPANGLPDDCVANCDHVMTIPIERLEGRPVSTLDFAERVALDTGPPLLPRHTRLIGDFAHPSVSSQLRSVESTSISG